VGGERRRGVGPGAGLELVEGEAVNGAGGGAGADGVDEDGAASAGEFGEDGQEVGAGVDAGDAVGQAEFLEALDGEWPDALVPRERVADADDEDAGGVGDGRRFLRLGAGAV